MRSHRGAFFRRWRESGWDEGERRSRETRRLCARHGAVRKEVRDTDVTLDLEARQCTSTNVSRGDLAHPLGRVPSRPAKRPRFLSPGASTSLFGGARLRLQILRKIISIYAKQHERLNPCSDNIDSIQPARFPLLLLPCVTLSSHSRLSVSPFLWLLITPFPVSPPPLSLCVCSSLSL